MSQTLEEPLQTGRDAFQRHAWNEAYESLASVDKEAPLGGSDLEALGEAAWWCGRLDECINYHERAHAAYLGDGIPERAAYMALLLVRHHFGKLNPSVAMGWFNQAERLLKDIPDCVENGYLAQMMVSTLTESDLDAAQEQADAALEIGMKFGDRTLQAYALLDKGDILIRKGEVTEGLGYVDEATVAAVSGEITPIAAGIIYCRAISACADLSDFSRAGEFTEAARRWCDRLSIAGGFPGICRVHRAEIIRLRGDWAEAEQEARLASDELGKYVPAIAAEALYEIGEIRLRMGDLPAAEEAFMQSHELMHDPQPGLALLRLAEGKVEAAFNSIAAAAGAMEGAAQRLRRAKLLPAMVAISIAAGRLSEGKEAAKELSEIAEDYGSTALKASAECALGRVSLAEGDAASAIEHFRKAMGHWKQVDAPYEIAVVRMSMAEAYRTGGDEDAAVMELRSARSAFDKLGAALDSRRAADLLGSAPGTLSTASHVTKTFMFTDIVKSTDLVTLIGDEAWEDLQHWHDATLRSLFASHQGQEVKQIGDGFLVAFDRGQDAIECAVAIQKKLVDHRRSAGFAPTVRVGIHTAEATAKGLDYGGLGVHEAARVGGLAGAAEIVASRSTLEAADSRFTHSEFRTVSLKGIAEPVEVADVQWR